MIGEALARRIVSAIQTQSSGRRWTIKPAKPPANWQVSALTGPFLHFILENTKPARFVNPFCYPLYPSYFLSLQSVPCALSLFLPVSNHHLLSCTAAVQSSRPGVIPFTEHIVSAHNGKTILLLPTHSFFSFLGSPGGYSNLRFCLHIQHGCARLDLYLHTNLYQRNRAHFAHSLGFRDIVV